MKANYSRVLVTTMESPVGALLACATDQAVCVLEFEEEADRRVPAADLVRLFGTEPRPGENRLLHRLRDELTDYFKGKLRKFSVPVELHGTPFQVAVWNRLLKIPYGRTASYEQIAAGVKHPGAQRAVGAANGRNHVAIVVPCHRVVKKDGKLGGYGGGLWRKKLLLDLEARVTAR